MQKNQFFSFLCNPAATMHGGWRSHLPAWGVPERLCDHLWESRHKTGALSRFLVERFQLCTDTLVALHTRQQKLLLLEEKNFVAGFIRLGSIFLYRPVLKIIDGAELRYIKQALGHEHFHFMRNEAKHLAQHHIAVPVLAVSHISKSHALLLGLAAFLKMRPPSPDLLTRLCFRLPPFAEEPRPPEGFALIRDQIEAQADLVKSATLAAAFKGKVDIDQNEN